jgi:hypothetical protein
VRLPLGILPRYSPQQDREDYDPFLRTRADSIPEGLRFPALCPGLSRESTALENMKNLVQLRVGAAPEMSPAGCAFPGAVSQ